MKERATRVLTSLTAKYVVVFTLLVGVSVVTTGAVQAYFSYRDSKRSLFRLQREKAKSLSGTIRDFLDGEAKRLQMIGPGSLLTNEELRQQLMGLVATGQAVSASYYGGGGRIRSIFVLPSVPNAARCGLRFARPLLRRIEANREALYGPGAVSVSPVYQCPALDEPLLRVATSEPTGNGISMEQVKASSLQSLIATTRLGETGYAYAVDARNGGTALAHPNSAVFSGGALSTSRLPQVERALALHEPAGSMVGRDPSGRKVLTAWATVEGIGWAIFVEQPLSQALAPLRASLWRTAILLSGFVLLTAALSVLLARRLVRPIKRMQVAAEAIGAGAYDGRIELERKDELGSLARAFNGMAERLQELIGGLERLVAERTRQLEQASKHKSEFLANMSHELRTPLNAIIGFSQVLQQKLFGEVNTKQEEYLEDIHSSANHLLALINDVLDLSKVEAGQVELEKAPFSLRESLERGVVMVRERAVKSGVQLSLESDPEVETVEADERRIRQVVFNLLSNAVKFTPAGGQVDVRSAKRNGEVVVSVADTGPGIALEDQARIFEEFQQTEVGQEQREGTGLGLALSKKLIELHGGRIWVESEPGQGSTFTFALPLEAKA